MNKIIREHYLTLGLDPEQKHSPDDIKRAYWRAAQDTHPDKNPGDELAEALFIRINLAYQALKKKDDTEEIHMPFQRASTQTWDRSTGMARQKSAEELAMELKTKIEQRMWTITRVRTDILDSCDKQDRIIADIENAHRTLTLSDIIKNKYAFLKRAQTVRPRMLHMIEDKLKDMKSGKLYDDIDEDGNISLKGTLMNFFRASKDLKEFILEIEKVIPGGGGGLPRIIQEAQAELNRLQRESPKMLGTQSTTGEAYPGL